MSRVQGSVIVLCDKVDGMKMSCASEASHNGGLWGLIDRSKKERTM